jgi:hypothetical protein
LSNVQFHRQQLQLLEQDIDDPNRNNIQLQQLDVTSVPIPPDLYQEQLLFSLPHLPDPQEQF